VNLTYFKFGLEVKLILSLAKIYLNFVCYRTQTKSRKHLCVLEYLCRYLVNFLAINCKKYLPRAYYVADTNKMVLFKRLFNLCVTLKSCCCCS
jgi:hypothetical protein